jgi:hypothetical protein
VTVVTKLGTLISAVLLASAVAGCGGASSPRAELSAFVVSYVDQDRGGCCDVGAHATVSHVKFARSNPSWAVVEIAVTDPNGRPDGHNFLIVRKIASTWTVIGIGTGALGCPVPVRIRADLAGGAPAEVLGCPSG